MGLNLSKCDTLKPNEDTCTFYRVINNFHRLDISEILLKNHKSAKYILQHWMTRAAEMMTVVQLSLTQNVQIL